MSLLTVISFTNMDVYNTKGIDFKGLFIISLLLLFPLLFLIQGILCAVNNTNIVNLIFSFGVSILDYIILMKIYLNDSAFEYVLIYSVLWIIGYTITYIVKKIKSSKSN
ncbi:MULTISPECIES: hypothetical protein [Clostridium]|uniref:Uncharacterized protein n=1 Tax=Clostridium aquiflavi TaxID=3073603 RepID=A0ABU1EDE2_9CLOT|nr:MULTISPECIES: hypothetical protein [unclassified Clostridium]MDR5586357.1 hypothetical protein [Clostridium sp. 5N-1]